MLDEKKAAIANYVLNQHDHDSLRLAIDIHDAFDAIRVRVIQEFTQKIVQYLINELPSEKRWLIYPKRLLEKPLEIYTNLIVRRDIWCNDLEVRIEAQSSGANNWIIGGGLSLCVRGRKMLWLVGRAVIEQDKNMMAPGDACG